MTRGKCTTYLGHCRNVFASMLSMNAGRKWTSCGKHWTTGSRNRDIEEDACCRRHTSNAVSQTVEARCCPPETSNTGQRGVRRLPKRRIKGSELVLETGGKLLGKSSNRFSLLPLRWTGSTSRMYYAIPPNMACSRPTRSDAVFSIGTTEILQLTITEKLRRKRHSG